MVPFMLYETRLQRFDIIMCETASNHSACGKTSCNCGGHGGASPVPPDPRFILELDFSQPAAHECNCSGKTCPRRYLAITGFMLGVFLIFHLALNLLALWPKEFQSMASLDHSQVLLRIMEIGLIFIPLMIHLALGLRTLQRERLRFGVEKHHHGSDLRQWLQRVTAVILLFFVFFHLITLHRWFGGRFDPHDAFSSASRAVWQFWSGETAGSFLNLLFAQFYLFAVVAAAYHAGNGLATGAEVLGWARTSAAQDRFWRAAICAGLALLLAGMTSWWALAPR
jgi:succinate dehydrogenase/fumarate reductase cytochrome b subunit (b558 family)